jgi:hypothetical protein
MLPSAWLQSVGAPPPPEELLLDELVDDEVLLDELLLDELPPQ